jgi:hypothetical protein
MVITTALLLVFVFSEKDRKSSEQQGRTGNSPNFRVLEATMRQMRGQCANPLCVPPVLVVSRLPIAANGARVADKYIKLEAAHNVLKKRERRFQLNSTHLQHTLSVFATDVDSSLLTLAV